MGRVLFDWTKNTKQSMEKYTPGIRMSFPSSYIWVFPKLQLDRFDKLVKLAKKF